MRKTAAVCVAKLYDINNSMVEDQGFLDALKDLLSDSNPMVNCDLIKLFALLRKHMAEAHQIAKKTKVSFVLKKLI